MSSLYEIEQTYLQALDAATDPESGLSPELFQDTLEGIEGEAEDKIHNVLRYARNLESEAIAIRAAMDAMKARRDAKLKRADWLREYALHGMRTLGKKKLEWPDFVVSIKPSPDAVMIDNEADIPDDFKTEVVETKVNKLLIKQAIKDGYQVPGAHIEPGVHLSIR